MLYVAVKRVKKDIYFDEDIGISQPENTLPSNSGGVKFFVESIFNMPCYIVPKALPHIVFFPPILLTDWIILIRKFLQKK